MKKIGLVSDTHGFIHPKLYEFFKDVDEIWHAGDLGSMALACELEAFKPLIAVHGNIDDFETAAKYPEFQRFKCEELDVLMTHIGGYPGKYAPAVRDILMIDPPKLFISGHSHIVKVVKDKTHDLLHINPGAAGKTGMHQKITFLKFVIEGAEITNMEIHEMGRQS